MKKNEEEHWADPREATTKSDWSYRQEWAGFGNREQQEYVNVGADVPVSRPSPSSSMERDDQEIPAPLAGGSAVLGIIPGTHPWADGRELYEELKRANLDRRRNVGEGKAHGPTYGAKPPEPNFGAYTVYGPTGAVPLGNGVGGEDPAWGAAGGRSGGSCDPRDGALPRQVPDTDEPPGSFPGSHPGAGQATQGASQASQAPRWTRTRRVPRRTTRTGTRRTARRTPRRPRKRAARRTARRR